jgi:hypothetical protein
MKNFTITLSNVESDHREFNMTQPILVLLLVNREINDDILKRNLSNEWGDRKRV